MLCNFGFRGIATSCAANFSVFLCTVAVTGQHQSRHSVEGVATKLHADQPSKCGSYQDFIYQTHAQLDCSKRMSKCTLKFKLKMLLHVSV